MNRLSGSFYEKPTDEVARDLPGAILCRKDDDEVKKGKVIEVEMYKGPKDKAAHASDGKTERNRIVWEKGGLVYTYLIYGLHWMLNIVTASKNEPECILIRAVDGSWPLSKTNGPGKLTNFLNIDKSFYGEDLIESNRIWLEKGKSESQEIIKTPRINIDYAGTPWVKKEWRYVLKSYKKNLPSP